MLNVLATAVATLLLVGSDARAQDFPTRNITLIVPFAAGSGIDSNARIMGLALADVLGVGVVVENVGGGGGTIGTARAAKATPDGYTLLIGNSGTHAFAPTLYKSLPYDPILDFEPTGLMTFSARILIVRTDLPVDNLQEFISYARANHREMLFASSGVGSATHLPCALLNARLGISPMHVPYRGSASALQDMVGRRIDYMCDSIQTGGEQVHAGHVKGIAVMAADRLPSHPSLPTAAEQGLGGLEAKVWNGFFYPAGTPRRIVAAMSLALDTMIDRPDIRKRMSELGLEVLPAERRTPAHMAEFLPQDIERWKQVIRDAGLAGTAGN